MKCELGYMHLDKVSSGKTRVYTHHISHKSHQIIYTMLEKYCILEMHFLHWQYAVDFKMLD